MLRDILAATFLMDVATCSTGLSQELSVFHGVTCVKVPLGTCMVGGTHGSGSTDDEFPRHECRVTRPIWMGQTEITVAQFKAFADSTGYVTSDERQKHDRTWKSDLVIEKLNTPVRSINWHDAREYCAWLGKQCKMTCRLPTEHEWEYACRAGATTIYPFGDNAKELHKYAVVAPEVNVPSVPLPVKSRPANAFGLYGMLGNVSEFCLDSINIFPQAPVQAHVAHRSVKNVVYRGGAWGKRPEMATCSYRDDVDPWYSLYFVGFRIVIEDGEGENPQ